jgi:hypothetical protein
MTGYITALWIIAGIFSCLIFTLSERRWIKDMELVEAMVLMMFYTCFVIIGPIGLTLLLIAQLIVFLSNL